MINDFEPNASATSHKLIKNDTEDEDDAKNAKRHIASSTEAGKPK